MTEDEYKERITELEQTIQILSRMWDIANNDLNSLMRSHTKLFEKYCSIAIKLSKHESE